MFSQHGNFTKVVASVLISACVALLALSCGGSGGAGDRSEAAPEPEGEQTTATDAEDPLAGMSVREMVGQMFVISVQGTEPDYYINKMIDDRNIGGALLFGYNMESERQVAELTGAMQRRSMNTEPAIPMFVAVDHEGGEVAGAPWVTPQPSAAELGASGDAAAARNAANTIGTELARAGVNTDFAPVFDTGFGAAIGSRSFGEDPDLVSEMGVAAMEGLDGAGIITSAKHFPNHGPAGSDSHVSLPTVNHDAQTIESFDLPPFRAAVEAGVPMVMVGHLIYPQIDPNAPTSLSPEAYRMLREDLGFSGVTVTDDLSMEGANGGNPPADAALRAVRAGADLLIISSPPEEQAAAYDAIVAAVESGEIPEERIRASAERILSVKKEYSLYEKAER
ncbi:glycoside hydrolase family 3 N-terminal domain-containing protein [Rubrobacter indicoceani]|uniref:glycoside hydrolase family 3 N-terminal domain-containing protein n=1 Tax=Rubrobacter indicoceani TaxID=2051957 RepID=UPI000E5C46E7|nr:glycoside hydrolase family 3 N-terminal domain-containing protein [Rubrobacter indicoceani]